MPLGEKTVRYRIISLRKQSRLGALQAVHGHYFADVRELVLPDEKRAAGRRLACLPFVNEPPQPVNRGEKRSKNEIC
jgi:hypothetical protein